MISESSFSRTQDEISPLKLALRCRRKIEKLDGAEHRYKITVTIIVSDAVDLVKVSVTGIGIFSIRHDDDLLLILKNAIAIIFPYLRSYVSIITTQPGLAPIMLPAININAMLDDQE